MININATLIIQAIHFFTAWFLLDRFLIRFLVHEIMQEDFIEQNKKKELLKKQELIEAQILLQKEHLNVTKKRFNLLIPEQKLPFSLSLDAVVCPLPFEPDKDQKKLLLTSLEKVIIKQVVYE